MDNLIGQSGTGLFVVNSEKNSRSNSQLSSHNIGNGKLAKMNVQVEVVVVDVVVIVVSIVDGTGDVVTTIPVVVILAIGVTVLAG